jgi:hypothetical protein
MPKAISAPSTMKAGLAEIDPAKAPMRPRISMNISRLEKPHPISSGGAIWAASLEREVRELFQDRGDDLRPQPKEVPLLVESLVPAR